MRSDRSRRTAGTGPAARALRIVLAGVIAASAVGVAQAYLSSAGVGSGTGATGTVGSITLAPASVTDALYPGETATVSLTAQNTESVEVRIGTLSLDSSQGTSGFARASGSTSCGLGAFAFSPQTNAGDGWIVPGNSTLAITLPDAVSASTTTANACQGVALTVYLKAS